MSVFWPVGWRVSDSWRGRGTGYHVQLSRLAHELGSLGELRCNIGSVLVVEQKYLLDAHFTSNLLPVPGPANEQGRSRSIGERGVSVDNRYSVRALRRVAGARIENVVVAFARKDRRQHSQ